MRDSDATPPGQPGEERTFYVINLCAAPVPLPLEMPAESGLEGLVVFRSHQVQDGRHRYRLHLGYFESREAAQRALPKVQQHYSTAWITAAPRARLGSLDDTGATDFRLIQAPAVSLAEFSAAETPAAPPVPARAAPAPKEEEPQRYAVQLVWSSDRTDPAALPPIALFEAYTVYTVTCQRGGVRLFGVRLGFFRSAISASQVALYVRPDFPSVAVVPVSDREFAYASWMVRHRRADHPAATPSSELATPAAEETAPSAEETAPPARDARDKEPAPMPTASVHALLAEVAAAVPESAPTPASPVARPPTQVEIARIRSPGEVPLGARDTGAAHPTARPASQHWLHAPRRAPEPDREARIAALGAHEIKLRAAQFDSQDERGATLPDQRPYRSQPFAERRSVIARLLSRLADRLG